MELEINVPQIAAMIQPNVLLAADVETGVFEPTEDVTHPTIPFSRQHDKPPYFYVIVDSTDDAPSVQNSSVAIISYIDHFMLFGSVFKYRGTVTCYSCELKVSVYNSSMSASVETCIYPYTHEGELITTSDPRYYVTKADIRPWAGNNRYFRAGRKYAWKAFWN